MTEEQIKQKAEAEADKVIIGSGMDRASVIHLKHLLTTLYVQGYLAGAEPREKQIAELKERISTLEQIKKETTDYTIKVEEERTFVKDQLAKAKYLLQKVADVCGYPNYDIPVELYADIADFLKDSEVEK